MWGHIILENTYTNNFNFSFPETLNDILLNLAYWQYWWWFWFNYFFVLYYFIFLRILRWRLIKFNPRLVTSFRSHGKWGDLLVCLIPISWCLNILTNSNFLLRLLEWQGESGLITIRVRGKQWYWVYKFELQSISNILYTYKNVGFNKYLNYSSNIMKTGSYSNTLLLQRVSFEALNLNWNLQLNKVNFNYLNTMKYLPNTFNNESNKLLYKYTNSFTYLNKSYLDKNSLKNSYHPFRYSSLRKQTHFKNPIVHNIFFKASFYKFYYFLEMRTLDWKFFNYNKFYLNYYYINNYVDYNMGEFFENIRNLKKTHLNVKHFSLKKCFFTSENVLNIKFRKTNSLEFNKQLSPIYFLVIKQKRYIFKKNFFLKTGINNLFYKNSYYKYFKFVNNNLKTNQPLYRFFKIQNHNMNMVNNKRLLRTRRILVLPAHINISVITNSFDVVHSWYIPGLGIKMDCVPGRSTHHNLYINNFGFYYGQCAEICGRYHHHMPIRICALPFEHFLIWWYNYSLNVYLSGTKNRLNWLNISKNLYVW